MQKHSLEKDQESSCLIYPLVVIFNKLSFGWDKSNGLRVRGGVGFGEGRVGEGRYGRVGEGRVGEGG